MKIQTSASVNAGKLVLDEALPLPDETRVQVTVEFTEDWRERLQTGLKKFIEVIEQNPIEVGVKFTREQLYERR